MIEISSDQEILQRVTKIENVLVDGLKRMQEQLDKAQPFFRFFDAGLSAYRNEIVKSNSNQLVAQLSERIRNDRELRFPHRKLLDFLLGQFDYSKQQFKEIHFSQLVKEARVGKNAAKAYLEFLEQKGYILRRSDGYRLFCKIRQ